MFQRITCASNEDIVRIKEILIEQYKYCDLNYCDKLIKVFYSKDSQNRILFLMMKNNTVVVRKQTFIWWKKCQN